jgi:hypothetical protein
MMLLVFCTVEGNPDQLYCIVTHIMLIFLKIATKEKIIASAQKTYLQNFISQLF